jgi:hypothetical protein
VSPVAAWYAIWGTWLTLTVADVTAWQRGRERLSGALEAAETAVFALLPLWAFLHHWWFAGALNTLILAWLAWTDWRRRARLAAAAGVS